MTFGISAQQLQLNDIDWPPYFFPDRSQYKPGLGKTILTSCIKQLGYDYHYNNLPIKRTHYYMQTGELDITVYSYQAAREDAVVYGKEPMFVNSYGFAVRRDRNIQIKSVEDISTMTFGHLAGLIHTDELNPVLKKMQAQSKVVESYELNATLKQLVATPPRIDITANSKSTLLWRIKELGLTNQVSVLDFELAQKPYYVAVSKNSKTISDATQFVSEFDHCVKTMKQDGRYQDIAASYGL